MSSSRQSMIRPRASLSAPNPLPLASSNAARAASTSRVAKGRSARSSGSSAVPKSSPSASTAAAVSRWPLLAAIDSSESSCAIFASGDCCTSSVAAATLSALVPACRTLRSQRRSDSLPRSRSNALAANSIALSPTPCALVMRSSIASISARLLGCLPLAASLLDFDGGSADSMTERSCHGATASSATPARRRPPPPEDARASKPEPPPSPSRGTPLRSRRAPGATPMRLPCLSRTHLRPESSSSTSCALAPTSPALRRSPL
mmetsp:Transcript_16736/g.52000  ORF Transcript_16736/g.52000 Transcript_16736/m.52000 type:complete len:262 (-) Transcript_16736:358-1143(-)